MRSADQGECAYRNWRTMIRPNRKWLDQKLRILTM